METLIENTHKDILELLRKRLNDFQDGYRQNVAILGEELIGKTTLLKKFLDGFQAREARGPRGTSEAQDTLPVYVEVLPLEYNLFLKRCLNSLLFNYLRNIQLLSSREQLDILVKRTKEVLPQTACSSELLLKKIDKERPEKLFSALFDIIETFSSESGRKVVIVFDEFHNLRNLGYEGICADLGKRIMLQKNSLFIFSSSQKSQAKEILVNDLSLLFGNFETHELDGLKGTGNEKIIDNVFGAIEVSKEIKDFLIYFTGNHPFYIKIISEDAALACKASGKKELEIPVLIKVLEKLLFQEWGVFNLRFTMRIALLNSTRSKNDFLYLLDSIALGKNRLKDLTQHLRQKRSNVLQKCHKLTESGILSRNGSFYIINDRLLSFWLKFSHSEKLNSLSHDLSEQLAHFRSQIHNQIEGFIQVSRKPLVERMMEVFNQFEGDEIHLDRKKFQLEAFKELKMLTFSNSNLKIGIFGKTQDNMWIAAVKEDGITEHDVSEFISMASSFKHKGINKILISLGDIDRNARLLAKESSISTWDIESVNNLFDIYGKPRIIR